MSRYDAKEVGTPLSYGLLYVKFQSNICSGLFCVQSFLKLFRSMKKSLYAAQSTAFGDQKYQALYLETADHGRTWA